MESDTREQTSDDFVHTSVQTEQSTQNDEPHFPEEDSDPQAAQDDSNATEPAETNSEIVRYPTRTHHPPEYFHIT